MLRGRQAGPSARYASVRSLPWGRDHCGSALARAKSGAPPAPRRSRGLTPAEPDETCHRHLSPAAASRHGGRGRSASTRLPALRGSPRRLPRATWVALARRRCKIWIPLHGIILPAPRGGEPRPSTLPPRPQPNRSGVAPGRGQRHAAPRPLLPRAGRAAGTLAQKQGARRTVRRAPQDDDSPPRA